MKIMVDDDDFPAKEEWITITVNEAWVLEFQNKDLQAFWIAWLNDIPTLARRSLKILTSVSTTYWCEQGFSKIVGMETQ